MGSGFDDWSRVYENSYADDVSPAETIILGDLREPAEEITDGLYIDDDDELENIPHEIIFKCEHQTTQPSKETIVRIPWSEINVNNLLRNINSTEIPSKGHVKLRDFLEENFKKDAKGVLKNLQNLKIMSEKDMPSEELSIVIDDTLRDNSSQTTSVEEITLEHRTSTNSTPTEELVLQYSDTNEQETDDEFNFPNVPSELREKSMIEGNTPDIKKTGDNLINKAKKPLREYSKADKETSINNHSIEKNIHSDTYRPQVYNIAETNPQNVPLPSDNNMTFSSGNNTTIPVKNSTKSSRIVILEEKRFQMSNASSYDRVFENQLAEPISSSEGTISTYLKDKNNVNWYLPADISVVHHPSNNETAMKPVATILNRREEISNDNSDTRARGKNSITVKKIGHNWSEQESSVNTNDDNIPLDFSLRSRDTSSRAFNHRKKSLTTVNQAFNNRGEILEKPSTGTGRIQSFVNVNATKRAVTYNSPAILHNNDYNRRLITQNGNASFYSYGNQVHNIPVQVYTSNRNQRIKKALMPTNQKLDLIRQDSIIREITKNSDKTAYFHGSQSTNNIRATSTPKVDTVKIINYKGFIAEHPEIQPRRKSMAKESNNTQYVNNNVSWNVCQTGIPHNDVQFHYHSNNPSRDFPGRHQMLLRNSHNPSTCLVNNFQESVTSRLRSFRRKSIGYQNVADSYGEY